MDLEQLTRLGFTVCGGQIDRDGVNYGFLSTDGPVLTPEGAAMAQKVQAEIVDAVAERVSPRRARKTDPGTAE